MIGTTPPRFSVLAKFSRAVEGRTHQTDGEETDDRRGAGEAGFGERLAAAARPDHVIGGRVYVVQPELWQEMRAVANGINRTVQYDTLRRP